MIPHVAARLSVATWPQTRPWRAGACGRDRSDPPPMAPGVPWGRIGMDTPCHPPREVATGQRSLAGRPLGTRNGRVPALVGEAGQPGGQPVGHRVLQRLEATLDTLPGRTVGWERPRSGGADGDVHRHPSRCRSRHAEKGGRSQPRPRWPDRHRRSGGRGTTASAPATYGTGGVSIADAISCPATPEAPCTLVDRHRYGRPAVKTGPPDSRLERHRGWTLEVETPSGYAFASANNPVADSAADTRVVTTGGAALRHHAAPTRREGGGAPSAPLQGCAILGGIEGGQGHPSPAPLYDNG